MWVYITLYGRNMGWDSAVGIVSCYVLDSTEIISRWGRDFPHPYRVALGLNQVPIQWVLDLSQG
jgi:hypothetical protein